MLWNIIRGREFYYFLLLRSNFYYRNGNTVLKYYARNVKSQDGIFDLVFPSFISQTMSMLLKSCLISIFLFIKIEILSTCHVFFKFHSHILQLTSIGKNIYNPMNPILNLNGTIKSPRKPKMKIPWWLQFQ